MKVRFLLAFLVFCSSISTVWAQQGQRVLAQGGIDEGGLVLGANFDFLDTANESYGGYLRLHSKDRERGAPAIFALGAAFRGRVKLGILEYYVSPGFGMVHYNLERTELLFGPSFALGVIAELDKNISLGIENSKLYSWVGDVKGQVKDSLLATVMLQWQ